MRILFVAMANSIHTARWIAQLADQRWDLHLFPSIDEGLAHGELQGVTIHHSFYGRGGKGGERARGAGIYVASGFVAFNSRVILQRLVPDYRLRQLARLIRRLRPEVIHSMEFQSAGYLTLEARRRVAGPFPKWIATNWGSDVYLFGELQAHRTRIAQILAACDFYSCECQRDVALAERLGLKGAVLPVVPNSGGLDLDEVRKERPVQPTSRRRAIMLKGYQGWAGRALVGLRALERCAGALTGYKVVVYSAGDDVCLAAERFASRTGIETRVLSPGTSHCEMLKAHGEARISIGLSIGDAISTSFLEAMAMGSFPIQSDTSCANEWAEDGSTALFVPPEDPEVVEAAIRRALSDDALVDAAAERNWRTVEARLDSRLIRPAVVDMYRRVAAGRSGT